VLGHEIGHFQNGETADVIGRVVGHESGLGETDRGGEIGRDMIWNPNDQLITTNGSPYFGGCHWIYVFKNDRRQANNADRVPKYDEGAYIMATLPAPFTSAITRVRVMRIASVGA
jgi:hypothetical protein